MKNKLATLIFSLISPLFAFSQECTHPDTAQMRQHKVKTVTVFYQNPNLAKQEFHVFEYDRRGRLIREKEGNNSNSIWKEYKYDEQNSLVEQSRVSDDKHVFSKSTIVYPQGKNYREIFYYEENYENKLDLKMVYRYDTLNLMIYQGWYRMNVLIHAQYLTPRGHNLPNDSRDSVIANREVYWRSGGHIIRMMKYDNQWKNPVISTYNYGVEGELIEEMVLNGDTKTSYVPKYNERGEIINVFCNGVPLDETEKKKWINSHRSFPRPKSSYTEDWDRYEYGLSIPESVETRTPVLNDKGLLISEKIIGNSPVDHECTFTYEYKYY
jgi:hypothetical protein